MQHNLPMARSLEAEDAFLLKARQGPRDGFKGRPEVIGNIATRHRKEHHLRMLQTVVHLQQKGGNFLERFLAAQE